MKIVADIDIPYLHGVLEPYAQVVYLRGADISPRDVADAQALVVRTRTRCDRTLLEGSAVEAICTATAGFDHIDTGYCARHGIEVATSAGCNARAVLQWVAAVLAHLFEGRSPAGTTLGVVGAGNVGSLVAQYAAQWGLRVMCCDPPRRRREGGNFVTLEELAPQCDVITFHTPLNAGGEDNTFHLADEQFFASLRRGTVILNASRGEVVESEALLKAVATGRCACVIDTWEHEPHVNTALVEAALLATPHIAGYTLQGKAMATVMAVRALGRRFALPLEEWYPPDGPARVTPAEIEWNEMCRTINNYFDIEALSRHLKCNAASFEQMRNRYNYRTEYF